MSHDLGVLTNDNRNSHEYYVVHGIWISTVTVNKSHIQDYTHPYDHILVAYEK